MSNHLWPTENNRASRVLADASTDTYDFSYAEDGMLRVRTRAGMTDTPDAVKEALSKPGYFPLNRENIKAMLSVLPPVDSL